MRKQLGITKKGNVAYIGENAINLHLFATGKSGVGKTMRILKLIMRLAKGNEVTIIINWRNNLNRKILNPDIAKEYEKLATVINIDKDGLALPLFTPLTMSNGEKESWKAVVQRVTALLRKSVGLSRTQEDITMKAVKDIFRLGLYEEEGLSAITNWLREQKKATAHNAAAKMACICDRELFYNGNFLDDKSKIFEIDLNGLEYDDQKIVVNFLLDYFLRLANKGYFLRKPLNIFLDEAQNFDFSEGSTLWTILNESRKLNLRMLLSAPSVVSTMHKDMNVITQCGTQLYFSPLNSERDKIAEMIDPSDTERQMFALSRLNKGECIACGNFIINEKEVSIPIMLQAESLDSNS